MISDVIIHTAVLQVHDFLGYWTSCRGCPGKQVCTRLEWLTWEDWVTLKERVDLWVIKIKKPMILCARSTSRSREQSTCSAAEHAIRLFILHQTKIKITSLYDYQTWQTTFLCTRRAKVCGFFSWLCFSCADWLGRQTRNITNKFFPLITTLYAHSYLRIVCPKRWLSVTICQNPVKSKSLL